MLQELETHRRTIEQKKGSAEKDDMDSDSGGKVEERLESLQVDESTKVRLNLRGVLLVKLCRIDLLTTGI